MKRGVLRVVDDQYFETDSQSVSKISATFLMPCLNEAGTVGKMVEEAKIKLKDKVELDPSSPGESPMAVAIDWELLLADNGSTDGSDLLARKAGATVIKVKEKGYGAAILAGIQNAKGEYVVFCDADSTYDPADAEPLVKKALVSGADLVLGSRLKGAIDPGAMPWMHRWVGTPFLSFLIRKLFQLPITDCNSGIRCVKKIKYQNAKNIPTGMEFASAQLVQASREGWKVEEVPATLRRGPKNRIPHLKRWRDGMRHLLVILAAAPGFFWGCGILALTLSMGLVIPSFWGTIQITSSIGIFGPHTQAMGTIIGFYGAISINLALLLYARYAGASSIRCPRLVSYFLTLPEGVLFWGLVGLSSSIGLGVATLLWMWVQSKMGALNQMNFALGLVYFAVVPLTLGVGVFQAHLQRRVKPE